ncbi:MAG: di-trans,poly-cis-decaprenylcistransferase [Candidatus Eisenbacteria bacterium]|nr:di-trans,poly-cis-decaprenylcistransferase [Candidatus Eisenbacteria bacterium]
MDGNGRWARKRGLPRAAGHAAGRSAVRDVVIASAEAGLDELTLYTFSMENWNRPRKEVAALMHLLDQTLAEQVAEMDENNIRLNAMGRIDLLPKYARTRLERSIDELSGNDGLRLNLAISYGGRAEIMDAVRAVAGLVESGRIRPADIDEEELRSHFYTPDLPDPDLLIRTSGESRISNFLLWQIAYTELYITDVLWPDFGRKHLFEALADYAKRERRFGRVSDQRRGRGVSDGS